MEHFAESLRAGLLSKGASLVGYADLAGVANAPLPYGVCIAVALPRHIVRGITDGPTLEYYQTYLAVNKQLEGLRDYAAGQLGAEGYKAIAMQSTIKAVGEDSLSTPLPHKTVATRAGLGWIGRCALLVTPGFGSAVRLITVLTDRPLPCGEPITQSRCGSCYNCTNSCPAGASHGAAWVAGMPRGELFDAAKCQATARRLAMQRFGQEATICGKCFEVCPFTQKYLGGA